MKLSSLFSIVLLITLAASGCAAAPSPTPTLFPTAVPSATELPTATQTSSATPTLVPTETQTPTLTPTITLTLTDTLTPTRTPSYNLPGVHPVGRCTDLPLHYTYGSKAYDGIVNLCLVDVLVRDDYKMQFNLVWHFASKDLPVPHRYVYGNLDTMLLVDDLGNRYDPLDNSGKTQDTDAQGPGENSIAAYYLFPRPKAGARVFSLIDVDKKKSIDIIVLIYR